MILCSGVREVKGAVLSGALSGAAEVRLAGGLVSVFGEVRSNCYLTTDYLEDIVPSQ